ALGPLGREGTGAADVDDQPAAVVPHTRSDGLDEPVGSVEVELDLALPALRARLPEALEQWLLGGGRVVDEDVDPAEGLQRLVDDALEILVLDEVGRDRECLLAERLDRRRRLADGAR